MNLLRPFDADQMTAWRVDKAVGNVKNDRADLMEPASGAPEATESDSADTPGSFFDA